MKIIKDANEAVARIAYLTNEIIALYPITPSSPMGEHADHWSSQSRKNVFGVSPSIIEMQSEAGAVGAIHGALQGGSLSTTFTASQGLLLMIPNLLKIAGELSPCVVHVASRAVATHGLSIFGDHSDVMAVRNCGWAMLCSSNLQEAQDFALLAQLTSLRSRIPFIHFFDGFRTSHELNCFEELSEQNIHDLVDLYMEDIRLHRNRALNPEHPVLRGTSQNPDVFFQSRERANLNYKNLLDHFQECSDAIFKVTHRRISPFEYYGSPTAKSVIVIMGSGSDCVRDYLKGCNGDPLAKERGVLVVKLYRPFFGDLLLRTLPSTVNTLAVLDRTKEPGSIAEPLALDVMASLKNLRILRGRYGLSSKEFNPNMVQAIFEECEKENPKPEFTIGIEDDLTHLSLNYDKTNCYEFETVKRAVFYGLGSDGSVGAAKNIVKIIAEHTEEYAQGYFVYDSKKAGSTTISHIRSSTQPIRASYLIESADYISCSQFQFIYQRDLLEHAREGAVFLLNSPYLGPEIWKQIPSALYSKIKNKKIRLYVIDAHQIARDSELPGRISTVMLTAYFMLAQPLPLQKALEEIKSSTERSYARYGEAVVQKNLKAIELTLSAVHEIAVPLEDPHSLTQVFEVDERAPDFVKSVTAKLIQGKGDALKVSELPLDGTYPLGTAKWEKRSIAQEIPIWEPNICTNCGLCAFVCPHAAIRLKVFGSEHLSAAPEGFLALSWKGPEVKNSSFTYQVAPDDCTGCAVCVEVCPAKSKADPKIKAINMKSKINVLERERKFFDYFDAIPDAERSAFKLNTVKGTQALAPLFEYSGACAGCGETPYLKLVSQLFGDRSIIANATGCSSIYGGNLPTTPWTTNKDGRGPAWSNSLFEDNAEFGLGIRMALDAQRDSALVILRDFQKDHPSETLNRLLELAEQKDHSELQVSIMRSLIESAKKECHEKMRGAHCEKTLPLLDKLLPKSVWAIGGDGWAYDIGFGGLDHALASGKNINILVLDTEVYSNTGGQASKATPIGAVAKFAGHGKTQLKKDLGMIAIAHKHVYVAQIAMGANPAQTIKAFIEAESYDGPSLIIAYSQCIAHGINMTEGMTHQKLAVQSGYWPLFRFDPRLELKGEHPFILDSKRGQIPLEDYMMKEGRFSSIARTDSERFNFLLKLAKQGINEKWDFYEKLAQVEVQGS